MAVLATWNVNSIRSRLDRVLEWLEAIQPDVLCLQETKVKDEDFPHDPFERLGYEVHVFGQKQYNGVAILSRLPASGVFRGLPDDPPDSERRLIGGKFGCLHLINVYVPNGTEVGSERFEAKLLWFRRLRRLLDDSYTPRQRLVVCGDFNVAPEDRDVYAPEEWRGKILFHPDEQRALRHLMDWGLLDALRLHTQEGGHYSWWDYRGGAFFKNMGLRIDLILISKALSRRCNRVWIDRKARAGKKPSDHAPVLAEFDL